MAIDLAQLQSILSNAETNEARIGEIRKAAGRVTKEIEALNKLLSADYQPEAKERKARAPKAPRELGEGETAPKRGRKPRVVAK